MYAGSLQGKSLSNPQVTREVASMERNPTPRGPLSGNRGLYEYAGNPQEVKERPDRYHLCHLS